MILIAAIAALCCTVSGQVHAPSGAPLANAQIALRGARDLTARSDSAGKFRLHLDPGSYLLNARADGYAQTSVGPIRIDRDVVLDIALEPADSPKLRTIGSVTVDGRLALTRDAVPSIGLSRAEMERAGYDRVIDSLAEVPSVTFARPDGGAASAPSVVALRGPDPSETLIALDGQILNDGNTGDLDLSRFPVAAVSDVDVTEGLGPQDSEGSNTIGGAVNLISLRPTKLPHSAFSFSTGSFGRSEAWTNLTGSRARLGYAFALDDQQEAGYVNQDVLLLAGAGTAPNPLHLGSTVSSRALLANLTYTFSQRAALGVRVFALGNHRDQSSSTNAPDPAYPGLFTGPGASLFSQTVRAYQIHSRAPLGAGSLISEFDASDNTVDFSGGTNSSYDVSHRDRRQTLALTWQRQFENSEIALGGYVRGESLDEFGVDERQVQHISSYFVRGGLRPTPKLRVSGAVFTSNYSSFGANLDGRLGASYDLSPSSVVRASLGTGFRAPLLIERYVFSALPRDSNCVEVGQGNPNERPEHATEYELGYSHNLAGQASLEVSLYRTNLRDPIENYYPLGASCPGPTPALTSYPVNLGNVVYQGAEVRFAKRFQHLFLNAAYGLNVAYPFNLPPTVSNPTTAGNLVQNEQFLGIPQQVGAVGLDWENRDWHAAIDTTLRGKNNELHQGPFAILNAGLGKRIGKLDVTLAGTNLTNAVAGPFTQLRAGIPYLSNVPDPNNPNHTILGEVPTSALFVEPAGFRLILTIRN